MGSAQRERYLEIEGRLRRLDDKEEGEGEGDDEEEGDGDDDDDDDARQPGNNAVPAGMQVSNVAFPGGGGFDGAFASVAGGQFEYRTGLPPFLSPGPKHIGAHAPKIAAVASRVAACQGVAMVYSRFVWAGLVPLAIALEHLGFERFEAPPLLKDRGGGGKPTKAKKRMTYAIISATRSIKSDDQRTLAALVSPENRDGDVIKVVLVSDKGSEGLDLKYVREVHVLEPWYHLNKIEQVVGRASRFCSHRDLPLERRNLTVYLHAATRPPAKGWGVPGAETVDLRAYRIAEGKQARILEVERVLREVAFDCHLNEPRMRLDANPNTRVDATTSQGVRLRNVALGRPARLGEQKNPQQGACECEGFDGQQKQQQPRTDDDSTYDPERHAFHRATYRRLIAGYFSSTSTAAGTHAQLWAHVAPAYEKLRGDKADRDRFSAELDALVAQRVEVRGPRGGRRGTIVQRGARYLFQPADETTTVLSDWDRGSGRPVHAFARVLLDAEAILLSPPPALLDADEQQPAAAEKRPPQQQQQQSAEASAPASVAAAVGRLSHVADQLLALSRLPEKEYADAAIEAALDRCGRRRLGELCAAVKQQQKQKPGGGDEPKRLRRVREIVARNLKAMGFHGPDCADSNASNAFNASASGRQGDGRRRVKVSEGVVGAVVAPRGQPVFKVLDVALANAAKGTNKNKKDQADGRRSLAEGGRGSGCVCHQSSVLTSSALRSLIRAAASKGGKDDVLPDNNNNGQQQDKRGLCLAYELALRKHSPASILRPGPDRNW
jgi:hypothetical protein